MFKLSHVKYYQGDVLTNLGAANLKLQHATDH
jgi:hypothetical protein